MTLAEYIKRIDEVASDIIHAIEEENFTQSKSAKEMIASIMFEKQMEKIFLGNEGR